MPMQPVAVVAAIPMDDGGAVGMVGAWCNEIDDVGCGGANVDDGADSHGGDDAINAGCVDGSNGERTCTSNRGDAVGDGDGDGGRTVGDEGARYCGTE